LQRATIDPGTLSHACRCRVMDKDIANSDPAEGARDVIERELKRHPQGYDQAANKSTGKTEKRKSKADEKPTDLT
jgi:hypothetical protein